MRVSLHGLDPLVIHALRGTFQGFFNSEVIRRDLCRE